MILHVEDLSNSCYVHNTKHVIKTLEDLGSQLGCQNILDKVISVGNKVDRVKKLEHTDIMPVSAKEKN